MDTSAAPMPYEENDEVSTLVIAPWKMALTVSVVLSIVGDCEVPWVLSSQKAFGAPSLHHKYCKALLNAFVNKSKSASNNR